MAEVGPYPDVAPGQITELRALVTQEVATKAARAHGRAGHD
jgi:hypothetical protein